MHIFQIFYSESTRQSLDPGFEPLDNTANERPDWREYWPIRNFLRCNVLVEEAYYGFLSPKFKLKTDLDAGIVREFCLRDANGADIVLFSPYFDQGALFWNVVEQGMRVHHIASTVFLDCVPLIAPAFDIANMVNTSENSVYCNFFVARPNFWRVWLERCEAIFAIAELNRTDLARALNADVPYGGTSTAPLKVFIIERVASMLLATETHWRVTAYRPLARFSKEPVAKFKSQLVTLDALKIAYAKSRHPDYRQSYDQLRGALISRAY